MKKFNVVCPDKIIFSLEYEGAMRTAHHEYEAVKREYIQRYQSVQMHLFGGQSGIEYAAWDSDNKKIIIVRLERVNP